MKQAIPTEYKNIRYRSKSEAIFARTLDISGIKYSYEDAFLRFIGSESYLPDFVCDIPEANAWLVIEYKPSKPSRTYLANCFRWWTGIKPIRTECYEQHNKLMFFGIFVFNFFEPDAPRNFIVADKNIETFELHAIKRVAVSILDNYQEAKNYRFDLAHIAAPKFNSIHHTPTIEIIEAIK